MPGTSDAIPAWLSRLTYWLLTGLTRVVVFTFTRWEIEGAERIPATGPVILVANHNHMLDPPLVAASCRRRVHPMGKRELFEAPLIGWMMWWYGSFPVRRYAADIGALRLARNYLRADGVVLMFPEGTRTRGKGMRPALPGAAMVALLSHAPVVPVAITGTDHVRVPVVFLQWIVRRRPHIRVTFGEPFMVEAAATDGAAIERATDFTMRRLAALLPERYRGAYGDQSAGTIVVARSARATGRKPR